MRTIFQSQDIAFHAPNFKDAVTILPLMDELTKVINHNRKAEVYENLSAEEREKYNRVWRKNDLSISPDSMEKILNLLASLGFESQIDLKVATIEDLSKIR